jgi:hypothetical protein
MTTPTISAPSIEEVRRRILKDETIQLRVTKAEKETIRVVASGLHLSTTEYLLKCHEVVAAKLRDGALVQVPVVTSVESHPSK